MTSNTRNVLDGAKLRQEEHLSAESISSVHRSAVDRLEMFREILTYVECLANSDKISEERKISEISELCACLASGSAGLWIDRKRYKFKGV
jgi:hypothetical protein